MKKISGIIFLLMLICSFAFASCDANGIEADITEGEQTSEDTSSHVGTANTQGTATDAAQGGETTDTGESAPHEHVPSDWIIDVKASCYTEGARHRECTECAEIIITETVERAHMSVISLPAKPKTCTTSGLTAGLACAECSEVIKAQEVIPAGHVEIVTESDMPDGLFCGDDGYYSETVRCRTCGDQISHTTKEIPEKHVMKGDKCTVCGLPQSTTQGMIFTLNSDGKSYTAHVSDSDASANIVVGVYNGLSVTKLSGVWSSRVRTVTLADCVKQISGFYGANITSVTIGKGVTEIPLCCFEFCTSLTTVRIGDNVQKIGEYAFRGCTNLTLAYMSGDHNWKTESGRLIYGNQIGSGMEMFLAEYLVTYVSEWNRIS